MKKRAISAVVAVVLFVLINVSAVSVLWTVIIPIIKDSSFANEVADLSIAMLEGYTVWDAEKEMMSVQIQRGNDDANLTGIQFIFTRGGNSISEIVYNVPERNQKKTYKFNLSEIGEPDTISIAPIFSTGEIGDVADSEDDVPEGIIIVEEGEDIPVVRSSGGNGGGGGDTNPTFFYYGDADADGYGNLSNRTELTSPSSEWVSNSDDCDDSDFEIKPGASEVPDDNVDQNCDGEENLTQCGTLSVEGLGYLLDRNILDISGSCFNIVADGITLDLNGYRINGDDSGLDYGVYVNGYNTIIIKNGEIDDFEKGIFLLNSGEDKIIDNILNSNRYGLYLESSFSNEISGNTVSNNDYDTLVAGIYLNSGSDNNIIKRNNLGPGNRNGIFVDLSLNNIIQDNIVNDNVLNGIVLYPGADGSEIINNTVYSNTYQAIYIRSSNNILVNNSIGNCNPFSSNGGCLFLYNSKNNNISGGIINTSSGNLISLFVYSQNNIFKDVQLTGTSSNDVSVKYASYNNVFINLTYTKEFVDSSQGTVISQLIRKWYYRAKVNSGGSPLEGASVSSSNTLDQFSLTTGSSGYTPVYEIIDYINNGTFQTDYSYTIEAFKEGYTSSSHSYSASGNNFEDVFVLGS